MLENISFYSVNYKDEERRSKMSSRFNTLDLNLIFVDPVDKTDARLSEATERAEKRSWSIMLQHLDSIRHFVEKTSCEYCIVAEDDILISKDMVNDLPGIINTYEKLELDVLLLGFLVPFQIYDNNGSFTLREKTEKYKFYVYPIDIWGSQMYMVSRRHAIHLLERYTILHANETIDTEPFSPDWTLTKYGKKALIYPMIAVEDGGTKVDFGDEVTFHRNCYNTNYVEGIHF